MEEAQRRAPLKKRSFSAFHSQQQEHHQAGQMLLLHCYIECWNLLQGAAGVGQSKLLSDDAHRWTTTLQPASDEDFVAYLARSSGIRDTSAIRRLRQALDADEASGISQVDTVCRKK